jgi:hypothetical protein
MVVSSDHRGMWAMLSGTMPPLSTLQGAPTETRKRNAPGAYGLSGRAGYRRGNPRIHPGRHPTRRRPDLYRRREFAGAD